MTPLDGWENFYVIVGSSAGALIGLQFVVMTLLADAPIGDSDMLAGNAFGTPNVVHFGVVLLLSALISIPWEEVADACALWGLLGLAGMAYVALVARRMRRQTTYKPVFEDWLFHALLPMTSYALLAISGGLAFWHARAAMFVVGTGALLLLFVAIHNAWDTVVWHVFVSRRKGRERKEQQ